MRCSRKWTPFVCKIKEKNSNYMTDRTKTEDESTKMITIVDFVC